MGFSTPAWIGQLAPAPADPLSPLDKYRAGIASGLDLGQKVAVRGALNNLDLNNPNSVQQTVGALARYGAGDAATGLLNLYGARAMQQIKLPLYQAVGAQTLSSITGGQQGQQAAPQEPDIANMTPEQHDHVLGSLDAMDGIEKQLSAVPYGTDGSARKALLAQLAPQLHDRGIDPALVGGFDPTDENIGQKLKEHAALRSAIMGMNPNAGTSQGNLGQVTPSASGVPQTDYGIADANLRSPIYSNPASVGILKELGVDPSDTLNRDVTITSPMRSKEAEAQWAGPISAASTAGTNLANTNPATAPAPFTGAVRGTLPNGQPGFVEAPGGTVGQTAVAGATSLGTEAGGHGGQVLYHADGTPVVQPVGGAAGTAAGYQGGISRAEAAGSTAGGAPGHVVTVDMGNGSTQQGTFTQDGNGNFTFKPIQGNGGAGLGNHPSPQQQAINTASAAQYQTDKQAVANSQASLVPMRKVLDIVGQPGVKTGPGTQAMNTAQSFINANLGWLPAAARPDAGKIASLEEARKYMVQIGGAQAAQYGPGTNEKLAVAASGNANPDISNMAVADVMRMNIALKRAEIAKIAGYRGAPEDYSDYAAGYARSVDPRAFMWDMQTPAERQKTLSTIHTPAEKRAFLRGREAAQAAGY